MNITIIPSVSEPFVLGEIAVFGTFEFEVLETFAPALRIDCEAQDANLLEPLVKESFITDLHEGGYTLLRPIPIKIERVGEADYLASFSEANIAIGGSDDQDAYQSLVAEILDTFDNLTEEEQNLGPDAAAQLGLLGSYLVKA
jgi:hypothetical protein